MFKKNKKLSEKLDTQVINLEEIKEVASTEKKIKKQKNLALLLLFFGLFMIILGILYPLIINTLSKNRTDIFDVDKAPEEKEPATENKMKTLEEDKNRMICTISNESSDVASDVNIIFEFNNIGLIKYKETTIFKAIKEAGKEEIVKNSNLFTEKYGNIKSKGVSSLINLKDDYSNATLEIEVDYREFDLDDYNKKEKTPLELSYKKGISKEILNQLLVGENAICK